MPAYSDAERPFWTDGLEAIRDDPVTPGESFDIVIAGAGYAGLNAAAELAKQGMKVLVVEARTIGAGASSKAAGSVANGLKARLGDLTRLYGRETAAAAYGEAVLARAFTEDMIRANGLDCDLQKSHRIVGAHSAKAFARLQSELPTMQQALPATRLLSREELASFVNAPNYVGGMLVPEAATLNPAKYQFGLASLAQKAGAKVRQHSRMVDFTPVGPDVLVEIEGLGQVKASHLYLATNAEAGSFSNHPTLQFLASRIVAVPSFVVISRPISRQAMDRVIRGARIFGDTRKVLNYLALAPCGTRLLYSSRSGFTEGSTAEKARHIVADYERRFPGTAGIDIDYFWTGRFAMTADLIPHIGSTGNVHWSTGCCGTGITMSSYLGHKVARRILRANDAGTVFDCPLPPMQAWRRRPALFGAAIRAYRVYDKYMN